jgi:excisionase family DNA binding protein
MNEVAFYLTIPKSTLYKMCSEREIPCAKIWETLGDSMRNQSMSGLSVKYRIRI